MVAKMIVWLTFALTTANVALAERSSDSLIIASSNKGVLVYQSQSYSPPHEFVMVRDTLSIHGIVVPPSLLAQFVDTSLVTSRKLPAGDPDISRWRSLDWFHVCQQFVGRLCPTLDHDGTVDLDHPPPFSKPEKE